MSKERKLKKGEAGATAQRIDRKLAKAHAQDKHGKKR